MLLIFAVGTILYSCRIFQSNVHQYSQQCTRTRSMCFASRTVLICLFQINHFVLYFSPLPLSFYPVITASAKKACCLDNNRIKDYLSHCWQLISRFKNFRKYFIHRCNLTWQRVYLRKKQDELNVMNKN